MAKATAAAAEAMSSVATGPPRRPHRPVLLQEGVHGLLRQGLHNHSPSKPDEDVATMLRALQGSTSRVPVRWWWGRQAVLRQNGVRGFLLFEEPGRGLA